MDTIKALLNMMGNPEKDLKAVHVAGTNGKGSSCWIMSSILHEAGYRVGSFLSPHIYSYRERFAINGRMITAEELNLYLNRVLERVPDLVKSGFEHPTEFEVLTAMAFEYFHDQAVDLVVLEVGLGGRYDSTNVLTPLLSVITTVDYDHTAVLGNSLEEIAWNKAGIIKPEVPVVAGMLPPSAMKVIERHCLDLQSPLYKSSLYQIRRHGQAEGGLLDIKGPDLNLMGVPFSLLGSYQVENLALVLTALQVLKGLGFPVASASISASLARVNFPGRMQILNREPLIIADAAHNPHGCRALAASLQELWPERERVLVCGMLDDKDASDAIKELGPGTRACIITRPAGGRSQQWRRLGSIWNSLFPDKELYLVESPREAVGKARGMLKPEEYMLISGSFYLLGAIYTNSGERSVNS